MRTRKILAILAVLTLTFVACFAVGCGTSDAKLGGYNDQAAVDTANQLIQDFIDSKTDDRGRAPTIPFSVKDTSKVVDVASSDFTTADFGTYEGTGDPNSDQEQYVRALIEDLYRNKDEEDTYQQGKIPVGGIVLLNFGAREDETTGYFLYIGNKKFVQLYTGSTVVLKDSLRTELIVNVTGYSTYAVNHMGGTKYKLRVCKLPSANTGTESQA
ncbi:MAG: hypothetical protein E7363_04710 [Clostridiales bacterium]|nr:hypothetical protein [Clostridiales bacterium]